MFTQSECDAIIKEYHLLQLQRSRQINRIWRLFLLIAIVIVGGLIIIFPNQFDNPETVWLLPVYGGMVILTALVGTLVSLNYTSSKPLFEYLFPKIIEHINLSEGLFLTYKPYDKEDRTFNKTGGLFTRMASVTIYRKITGMTEDEYKYTTYDCKMVTSNGKSSQTHFAGIYYILEKETHSMLQIRTSGRPALKGEAFKRVPDIEDLKVYVLEGNELTNLDYIYLDLVRKIRKEDKFKKIVLGLHNNEIHLALWYDNNYFKKPKTITIDYLNLIASRFIFERNLANRLGNVSEYNRESTYI